MYDVSFSNQSDLLVNREREPVQSIYTVNTKKNNGLVACVRSGNDILGYRYETRSGTWNFLWNQTVFNLLDDYSLEDYPWLVTSRLLPDKDIIVLRHPKGVRFYNLNESKPGLELLKEDKSFSKGIYNVEMFLGSFFPDADYLGVMTKNDAGYVRFYGVTKDSFSSDSDPLFPLIPQPSLASSWGADETTFVVTKLQKNAYDAIGVCTSKGIEFFKFNEDYLLQSMTNASKIVRTGQDHLFFGDVTNGDLEDVLHLNNSGLFLYKHNDTMKDYTLLHHSVEFSRSRGWLPYYSTTIRLVDLNGDGRDDLLFTGSQGLSAFSFDHVDTKWEKLIDPHRLRGPHRFATVVQQAVVSPTENEKHIVLFTQDTRGHLNWARISKTKESTVSIATTSIPIDATPRPTDKPKLVNVSIPVQVARTHGTEKLALRWTDQWDVSFLTEPVNVGSGQVQFKVPLVDTSIASGGGVQLAFSYSSNSRDSDFLGVGWSAHLANDFITVDYGGSVFPEDARYYLVVHGNPQPLKLTRSNGVEKHFQFTDGGNEMKNITMKYHTRGQRWVIEDESEKAVYGKASNSKSREALRWVLGWPNWRGVGRDKSQQEPLIDAWYLNCRFDKVKQKSLYYTYEIENTRIPGGKAYTSAIRLKSVADGESMQVFFEYANKQKSEYKLSEPVDDEGNISFPVALSHPKYLQSIKVTTASYSQRFELFYQVEDNKRLLTNLKQHLQTQYESLLEFTYKTETQKKVLKSCSLVPYKLTHDFSYEIVAPPSPTFVFNNVLKYSVQEMPRIAYAQDYAVMAYRDLHNAQGMIIFRVMTRELTRVLVDCSEDVDMSCPNANSKIIGYNVQAYQDSFTVYTESQNERIVTVYDRTNQTWSSTPFTARFSGNSMVRVSEKLIAVADPKKQNLQLIHRDSTNLKWTTTELQTKNIKYISVHNQLVVAYDDVHLSLFKRSSSGWIKNELDNLGGGLATMNEDFVESFDVKKDVRQKVLNTLSQGSLQFRNNLVLLSGLKQQEGSVHSYLYLYLLNQDHKVAGRRYEFITERECLCSVSTKNNIELNIKNGDIILHLSYQRNFFFYPFYRVYSIDNMYRLQISYISGKKYENAGTEAKTKIKEGFKKEIEKIARENFLLNLNLYTASINQHGVSLGNDTQFQFLGTDWKKENIPNVRTTRVGKDLILETDSGNDSLVKLYSQSANHKKNKLIEEMKVFDKGAVFTNRYPRYFAYHEDEKLVKVRTFNDDKTLGHSYSFKNELLMGVSDWQNFVTFVNASEASKHPEAHECWVRPVSTLILPHKQLFVSRVKTSDGETVRLTGYRHSFETDTNQLTYTETVSITPGDNVRSHGTFKASRSYQVITGNITTKERWFDNKGEQILEPIKEESANSTSKSSNPDYGPTKLFDKNYELLISDFAPFKLEDEDVAYYGFESYETNSIGNETATNKDSKSWRMMNSNIVDNGFAFTGKNYLHLGSSSTNGSFIEGVLQPRDQTNTYIAACWIRCNRELEMNSPAPYLKATVSTSNGQEIASLQGNIKQKTRDWSYLELIIDLGSMMESQKQGSHHTLHEKGAKPNIKDAILSICLRIETNSNQPIDLDHIRFHPIALEFQANVFNPLNSKRTDVIQANGLVRKVIYNRLQKKVANLNEDGQLKDFNSRSKTGGLFPRPIGGILGGKPSSLTFEPENGSFENFEPSSWRSRWEISDKESGAWNVSPGQLWHVHSGKNEIKAKEGLFDQSSAIRFYFILQTREASIDLQSQKLTKLELKRNTNGMSSLVLENTTISNLPIAGELIVMMEEQYIWVWIDGVLIIDQSLLGIKTENPWLGFGLSVVNTVLIEDLLIMNHPLVTVSYFNGYGEEIQHIQLEATETAQVKETLYDELGRDAITSKTTRVYRKEGKPLLMFHQNFVTNKDPNDNNSVWKTGELLGDVNLLNPFDQGVAYLRTEYESNTLNEPKALGLPGPEFSITSSFAVQLSQYSDIPFLEVLFPKEQGYRQKVKTSSNGNLNVSVFNKLNLEVARYVRVPGFNHLLSTYEYDTEKRLTKILPPLYHKKVHTVRKKTPWQPGEEHLSSDERLWQKLLATHFTFDEKGNLVRKRTPDSGETEFIYNSSGRMRFMVSLNSTKHPEEIVYFDYESDDMISETGYLENLSGNVTTQKNLKTHFLKTKDLPNARKYQHFHYVDNHRDPLLRGNIKYCLSYNYDDLLVEKLIFNSNEQVVSKSAITAKENPEYDRYTTLQKEYVNKNLHKLIYPTSVKGQPLNVVHSYNKLGQLVGLGTSVNPTFYASFTYLATGEVASEQYQPDSPFSFTRHYSYNSPGYLKQISDPYLTEDIAFSKKGYGQSGFGDGMVMETAFNASWPANADGRWFQVRESDIKGNFSAQCFLALKNSGYLSKFGQPLKFYAREEETELPLMCVGNREIDQILAAKQLPTYYGHRYAYGNHQELVKAKYFNEETDMLVHPLQFNSFSTHIPNITAGQSQEIWQLLKNGGFLVTNQQRSDPSTDTAKVGKSFFKSEELYSDLGNLNENYTLFVEPIQKLALNMITKQKYITVRDFEEVFLKWKGLQPGSSKLVDNWQKPMGNEIGKMLFNKGYFPSMNNFTNALDKSFTELLQPYSFCIPEIVKVLLKHFAYELGESPFDVESYQIDANGNHRLFYTGFDRYELAYRNGTNQIESVKLKLLNPLNSEKSFSMNHDGRGNVVEALHKGIKHIEYNPVSRRATRIQMVDRRTIRFTYDAYGERKFKRVFDAAGKLTLEVFYLRDEKGRVLLDQQTRYFPEATDKILTAYLYGPRGLLGFIRDNEFYSVTTDHSGSVRLVVREGTVVAAYDYMPYGQLMRKYGSDRRAQIVYRYTGQEYDEETGLYNYHARLYDPSIGRFYQVDPKEQYSSPYKYAGNSPISVVDPDGEFAFLLTAIIIGAIVGAYLGGASANGKWNPIDWDLDSKTLIGIFFGAITGALMPLGFGGLTLTGVAVATALGVGVAYISASAENNSWNPLQWDWKNPKTYNALFEGFSTGSGLLGGLKGLHKFGKEGLPELLGIVGKKAWKPNTLKNLFIIGSISYGGGLAYVSGISENEGELAFWKWDWSNPGTWLGVIGGFSTGIALPQNFIEIGFGSKEVWKILKSKKHLIKDLYKKETRNFVIEVLENPNSYFYKVTTGIFVAYLSAGKVNNNTLDITRWQFSSFTTYQGILDGVFLANGLYKTKKELTQKWHESYPYQMVLRNFDAVVEKRIDSLKKGFAKIKENRVISYWKEFTTNKIKTFWKKLHNYAVYMKESVQKVFDDGFQKNVMKLLNNLPKLPEIRAIVDPKLAFKYSRQIVKLFKGLWRNFEFTVFHVYPLHPRVPAVTTEDLIINNVIGILHNCTQEQETVLSSFQTKNISKECASVGYGRNDYTWGGNLSLNHWSYRNNYSSIKKATSVGNTTQESKFKLPYSIGSLNSSASILNFGKPLDANILFEISQKKLRIKRSLNTDWDNGSALERLIEDETNQDVNIAHSSGDKVHFWPMIVVKKVGSVVSSLFSSSWITETKDESYGEADIENFLGSHPPPIAPTGYGPSVTEMGDAWLNNTNMNSLLTLGVLLARKRSGHKPTPEKTNLGLDKHIDLDIKSAEIVNEFMDMILENAEHCGVKEVISELTENPKSYFKAVEETRKHLRKGELSVIPKLLYVEFVSKKIQTEDSILSKNKVGVFLSKTQDSCLYLQQKLSKEEQNWLPSSLQNKVHDPFHKYCYKEEVEDSDIFSCKFY